MAARRKPFAVEVEEFALRSIKRHTAERDFEAVAEVFAWIGQFHEMQAQPEKETEDVQP
jgi:hypothetical protein